MIRNIDAAAHPLRACPVPNDRLASISDLKHGIWQAPDSGIEYRYATAYVDDSIQLCRIVLCDSVSTRTPLSDLQMATSLPDWHVPSNLKALMEADEDLTWESDRWSPIQLSVIGGTSYDGRDIDQSWQIDYEPDGCDGYEMLDRILAAVDENDPDIRPDLNCDDTEDATLVIWTESEDICRRLMALAWPIVHES